MRNYLKLIIAGLISIALVSCGGTGSCSNCTPTPRGYPVGVAAQIPIK